MQYVESLTDLGMLLFAQYAEYNSESALSAGWSRGSLHYSSVESAVSRHLAATCSKLLQEALGVVVKTLHAARLGPPVGATGTTIPANATPTSKQIVALLVLQARLEYALGKLSLTISAEALRMHLVCRTTTATVDEVLAVRLLNKSRIAQAHGVESLQTLLPVTLDQLRVQHRQLNPSISDNQADVFKQYMSQLENYQLGRYGGNSPRPAVTPTRGIGIDMPSESADSLSSIALPDQLKALLERVAMDKLSADAALLLAEYFVSHAVTSKTGEVNAAFVRCMAPITTPSTTKIVTPSTVRSPTSNAIKINNDNLPLPRHISKSNLAGADTSSAASSGNTTTLIADVSIMDPFVKARTEKEAYQHAHRNAMYPLLLHTGVQDLRFMLLDREYLVHQQEFVQRLNEQNERANTTTVVTVDPSTAASAAAPTAATKEVSLAFTEVLDSVEESELTNATPILSYDKIKFSNAALVNCYRTAKTQYLAAMVQYTALFGGASVLASEVRILLANIYRMFGFDEEAKPLYEASLKVFKSHSLATYQLPTATSAHCWLGLASYFNDHLAGLPSLYEHDLDTSTTHNTHRGASKVAVQKTKNDLALRLYEEALNIYQCVYPSTHFTVALTSQALVGVLCGLKRFDRGTVLLNESISSTRLSLGRDRIMQRYLRRQLKIAQRKASGGKKAALSIKTTMSAQDTVVARLELALESNELALQSTIGFLGTLLVLLGRLNDLNKQHHSAIVLYKEAIVCMRELRLSMVRRFREKQAKAQQDNPGRISCTF